ncbi:MutS-related protein [Chryseolinea soli]|uniref:DNA mismatch repair protein n=1 Tax=Chryseolinea soli TaxID=2321403 RepID=A0A385SR06_9BACT|nr:DNA mismatch repair protein [Chryseolinea soli]AYB31970.1 DNA mismatch repair protein [Chryseolinea soli]
MVFATDKQTLEDLNIFGRQGGGSILAIFNRCVSRGGSALLEEMFQAPLRDGAAITNRCRIIEDFAAGEFHLPIKGGQFDVIEPYLATSDERTRLSVGEGKMGNRIEKMLAPDIVENGIKRGVAELVMALRSIRTFITSQVIQAAQSYGAERDAIQAILIGGELEVVFQDVNEDKFNDRELAAFDSLLRFRHREPMQKLMRLVYQLDVYLAVAQVARERNFIFPIISTSKQLLLKLEGVCHPAVQGAIANSLDVGFDKNVLFLTGANMAGKSTFMKTLGVALYLAHMGFPVPATAMVFSVMDGLYTTINLSDNLSAGSSHFYAEVLRLKKIANELGEGKKLVVIFDELFRGTNVSDAHEATVEVVSAFATRRDSLFVVSTHIIEAGHLLEKNNRNIRFIYMPTKMKGHVPVYTYILEEGITADRHGMVIIRNEKILEMLKEGIKAKKGMSVL